MKKSKKRYRSTEERAKAVRELLEQYYEPGRQDRCKHWVYRNYICKRFGISERTFFRYLGIKISEEPKEEDKRQMSLF